MMMIANSHDDDDSHDDSYSSISSPIYPSIYRLIMDIKINISIDTLCYGLPGKHATHAPVRIMSSSIYHPFINIVNSIIINTSSYHHHHHHHHLSLYSPSPPPPPSPSSPSDEFHQYFEHVYSLGFDDAPDYVHLLRLFRELFKNMQ